MAITIKDLNRDVPLTSLVGEVIGGHDQDYQQDALVALELLPESESTDVHSVAVRDDEITAINVVAAEIELLQAHRNVLKRLQAIPEEEREAYRAPAEIESMLGSLLDPESIELTEIDIDLAIRERKPKLSTTIARKAEARIVDAFCSFVEESVSEYLSSMTNSMQKLLRDTFPDADPNERKQWYETLVGSWETFTQESIEMLSGRARWAAGELIQNHLIHGNHHDLSKKVSVFWGNVGQHDVYFESRDEGEGFEPGGVNDPTLDENLEKESGRGLAVTREYFNNIHFPEEGGGTIVQFTIVVEDQIKTALWKRFSSEE